MSFLDHASMAIREAGGRFTPQRQLIVELIDSSDRHLDAEELHRLAQRRDRSISLATVYRTLNVLEEAGLIDQRYLSHGHERKFYEPASTGEHYHFTCRVCHRVIEFEAEQIASIKQALEATYGLEVRHACVCFEGLCADCRRCPGGIE